MSAAPPADANAAAPSGPSEPKGPLILALANTLLVLAATGTLAYTRVLFKRPPITETAERERLEKASTKATPRADAEVGYIAYDPITANIEPSPAPANTEGVGPTLHYITIAFSLELSDVQRRDLVDDLKPKIMDQLLSILGRKKFQDLTTVQGRYLLRTQIADSVNKLVATAYPKQTAQHGDLVSNVYFNQFIVQ